MICHSQPVLFWFLLACTLCGCGGQQTTALLQDLQDSPFIPAKNSSEETIEELFTSESELDLPNPDRVNPFQESGSVAPASSGLRPLLKGFVEREQPQVVLTLGGRIAVVGEGDSFEDVTILEIRPPQVVYRQRGVEHRLSL
ncbi:MAG: hypothetical protein NXI04_24300 [Planctomycetaceae bacterium]|nr:hypothetical protein [Planctomycetaceae bacterium]